MARKRYKETGQAPSAATMRRLQRNYGNDCLQWPKKYRLWLANGGKQEGGSGGVQLDLLSRVVTRDINNQGVGLLPLVKSEKTGGNDD